MPSLDYRNPQRDVSGRGRGFGYYFKLVVKLHLLAALVLFLVIIVMPYHERSGGSKLVPSTTGAAVQSPTRPATRS
jgi:hypothetical protein